MSLPAFKPNITEYSRLLAAAKASLQAAAKQAAAAAVKEGVTYRPIKCPNGQPLVTCTTWDVCKGKCSNKQVCQRAPQSKCIAAPAPRLSAMHLLTCFLLHHKLYCSWLHTCCVVCKLA